MDEIIVKLKPEDISWQELADCQRKAHESNRENGVVMQCADVTAVQLKDAVNNGLTLVALDKQSKLMGMLSVGFNDVNRWWHKGKGAYICFVAVQPEYKGRGIYKALGKKAIELINSKNVKVEYLHTHYGNKIAQRAYERDGYRKVRFMPGNGTDYYSVEMAKWIDGQGKSNMLCKLMYVVSKIVVKLLYKPGKIRRFKKV